MIRSAVLREMRFGVAGALALATLACASPKNANAPLPPVVQTAVRGAWDSINAGKFDVARELIAGLKKVPQAGSLENTIRSLEERLQGKELGDQIQAASTITVEPDMVSAGKIVNITLQVKNPGKEPLHIPAKKSGFLGGAKTGGLLGRWVLLSLASDAYGTQLKDRSVTSFEITDEVVIAPQESWTQRSSVPVPYKENIVFHQYSLFCELRPDRIEIGKEPVFVEALTIGPAKFRAFPEGYEKLAENPLESLRKALPSPEEKFDPHVFISAVLMKENEKKAAVRACMEALSKGSAARRQAVMASLRWLTGATDPLLEEERWKNWWSLHHKEYEESGGS